MHDAARSGLETVSCWHPTPSHILTAPGMYHQAGESYMQHLEEFSPVTHVHSQEGTTCLESMITHAAWPPPEPQPLVQEYPPGTNKVWLLSRSFPNSINNVERSTDQSAY
ncbi:hypothetical protein OH77DRAFT_287082 [Trametes cingulata]|nr:hypothetical protein OH77DRAFT_287082 [Trametes cingulata]